MPGVYRPCTGRAGSPPAPGDRSRCRSLTRFFWPSVMRSVNWGGTRSLSEMQGSDLTLFVCETYREEVTYVVSGIPGIRIRTCFFPHFCSSGYQRIEEIRSFFSSCLLDGEAGLYFGDSELVRRGILPAGVHHAGPDSCHELIDPGGWRSQRAEGLHHTGVRPRAPFRPPMPPLPRVRQRRPGRRRGRREGQG